MKTIFSIFLLLAFGAQAQVHRTYSSASLTGAGVLTNFCLVPSSSNTKLYNLNAYNSTGTAYLQIYDSYTAATPGSATVTVVAATDLFTLGSANASWTNGTPMSFTSSTTLPAPLASNTLYYVTAMASTTTLKVSTTLANALASTALDITSTGTGTITAHVLDGGPTVAPAYINGKGNGGVAYNTGRFFTNGIYGVLSGAEISYSAITAVGWFDANYSQ